MDLGCFPCFQSRRGQGRGHPALPNHSVLYCITSRTLETLSGVSLVLESAFWGQEDKLAFLVDVFTTQPTHHWKYPLKVGRRRSKLALRHLIIILITATKNVPSRKHCLHLVQMMHLFQEQVLSLIHFLILMLCLHLLPLASMPWTQTYWNYLCPGSGNSDYFTLGLSLTHARLSR